MWHCCLEPSPRTVLPECSISHPDYKYPHDAPTPTLPTIVNDFLFSPFLSCTRQTPPCSQGQPDRILINRSSSHGQPKYHLPEFITNTSLDTGPGPGPETLAVGVGPDATALSSTLATDNPDFSSSSLGKLTNPGLALCFLPLPLSVNLAWYRQEHTVGG